MKNSIVAPIIQVLTGCSPLKFCSNPGLTENSGLKYLRKMKKVGRPESESGSQE